MCGIGQRIWQRGFCAGNEGNFSVRLGQGEILCTPTGVSKGFMWPALMVVVDRVGKQIGGGRKYRPTSEIGLHLAIYQKRPDVKAIIHSHPPHATAFACAAEPNRAGELPRGVHPEAEVFLGRVPVVGYCTPGTKAVGERCCEEIGPRTNSVLLGNHGAVCFGETLTQAWGNLEMVEAYCRLLVLLRQIGEARKLTAAELRALMAHG
jgi:L-fuculose-phosphate aldolase